MFHEFGYIAVQVTFPLRAFVTSLYFQNVAVLAVCYFSSSRGLTYFRRRYLEIDNGRCERSLGQLRRVVDSVAVEHDELQSPRQLKDTLDLFRDLRKAGGARVGPFHDGSLGRVVEE